MGTSSWSDDYYREREAERAKTGATVFAYHAETTRKPVEEQKVHPQMDPKGVTRESRDSDAHPESISIAVILDETGSMAESPIIMQRSLPKLNALLVSQGVKDPQVLFGAVGDECNHERASIQIGQFESGLEMEDDLGKIFMEHKGGGSGEESYQNALYFFARHASCDCYEKRGRKGYLFIVGDERAYPYVYQHEIKNLFGDDVEADIPLKDIVRECQQKFEVYYILPGGTNHCRETSLHEYWREMLGGDDRLIQLEDPSQVCEAVAAVVAGNASAVAIKGDDKVARL